ncbi:methyl-accepting chemotaxis protein [Paucibacter sp. PLA-PC-4]|uniref:methyl-accepting chemotaxis protein n=1 Tax=Paucibacter sp. PLA-PC-4 TaxID=2993655 RepID=UPI002B059491|nr:methyl-accepting chemotaxis protein [Paucibacter sp. PLA-PC-4]
MSLINPAARQRMLSQRMVLQTVLAAGGSTPQLKAARASLTLFTESQQKLVLQAPQQMAAADAERVGLTYQGPQGVAPVIDVFARQVGTTLNLAERASPRVQDALAQLVDGTDAALEALNTATTTFDQIGKARSDAMMKELSGIVASIQTVAREAKIVSFNAQVMAARAGQHGREFAVVANVLSGITHEIDGLSHKAVALAERGPS